MSEKTSILLSDVTVKGDIVEKEKPKYTTVEIVFSNGKKV